MTKYVSKLALTTGQIELIKNTVKDDIAGSHVYIFGSRVRGTAKKYSDIDIALDSKTRIDNEVLFRIKEKLENQLPYLIELVDLNLVSKEFRKVIQSHYVELL